MWYSNLLPHRLRNSIFVESEAGALSRTSEMSLAIILISFSLDDWNSNTNRYHMKDEVKPGGVRSQMNG